MLRTDHAHAALSSVVTRCRAADAHDEQSYVVDSTIEPHDLVEGIVYGIGDDLGATTSPRLFDERHELQVGERSRWRYVRRAISVEHDDVTLVEVECSGRERARIKHAEQRTEAPDGGRPVRGPVDRRRMAPQATVSNGRVPVVSRTANTAVRNEFAPDRSTARLRE